MIETCKEKGTGMKIHKSAIVHPDAVLGEEVEIGPFSIIGANVTIEEGTIIKNHVTITGNTSIGKNNIIHPNALLANGVLLGGHIMIERGAKLMGLVGIQPFVTIGRYAYVGGHTRIVQDVPPYVIIEGHPAKIRQGNVIGLEREGFSGEQIDKIKDSFRVLFRSDELNRNKILGQIEKQEYISPEVEYLITF